MLNFLNRLSSFQRYSFYLVSSVVGVIGPFCFFQPELASRTIRRILQYFGRAASAGSFIHNTIPNSPKTFGDVLRYIKEYLKEKFR
jgi:hypothetical protein